MSQEIFFSIIMATYNSENTIDKALSSIRNQEFEQSQVEILIVDGGSTDNTREIAQKYGAIVVENPYKLPEPAKMIGLKLATGRYICIMDSDEEISGNLIFAKRKKILEMYSNVKCLAIGLFTPENSDPCCHYINAVGDPFTCFIYKTYKNGMEGLIKRKGLYYRDTDCYIAQYDKNDIRPIGDSGTVMDLNYIKSKYWEKLDYLTTATIFDMIIRDTGYVTYLNNDNHYHYTSSSFKTYLRKLKFRITNNIFDINGSGYSNKAENNEKLSKKKYFYPIYVLSVVFPCIDGIRMSFHYKHWIFLLHPVFAAYVLIQITFQYLCKLFGIQKKNDSYAK